MHKWNPIDWTWGYEIEWGDITKSVAIPEELGSWEYCECDILNLNPPYRGLAVDPYGINPPVGGEVNTKPTYGYEDQVDRIMDIHDIFVAAGDTPTAACVNHGHVHVRIPGLSKDMASLKQLTRYIQENQDDIIDFAYGFVDSPEMKGDKNKTYLKYDGGRKMPEWLADNLMKATDLEDYIRIYQCGKDGVSRGRPLRFAVNLYCLKHTDTIEFRCFRSSTNRREIFDSFRFAEDVLNAALYTGETVKALIERNGYKLPPFNYSRWESDAWAKTKKKSDASLKKRELHEVIQDK